MKKNPKYRRILLKYSGEALMGDTDYGIDPKVLDRLASEVGELVKLKVQVAIVIGGGNLFRGEALSAAGIGRVTGDHMGMLATLMNSLALCLRKGRISYTYYVCYTYEWHSRSLRST
jgi:uridylate kinase